MNIKNFSLSFIAFFQALGLVSYCSLIAGFFNKANTIFGSMNNALASTLFLLIFIVSALICALMGLGYSGLLFFKEKKQKEALKLVGLTSIWLLFFVLIISFILINFK